MWKLKQFIPKEPVGLEGRTIDVGRTKVQVRNVIAEGGFSCVYLALDVVHPSKQYALKHIICNDEESLSLVMKEISVMKLLKGHQNIVTLAASDIFDMGRRKEAFLLMDFCEKSLVSVLESRGAGYYDEKQILLIFRDACNAVFAMHCQSPPIAHRDLKAENLLLGSDGTWKLCDFGSTSTNHKCFDKPGEMGIEEDNIRKYTTPAYRPPEMWDLYRKEVISEKVDIWALGCLLYRICYFKSAFDGESKLQILNGNYRIPDLPKYSSSITDLIKDMLQASPDARPDVTQVWFRVNLQLPQELQKETPDGSLLTAMPDMHMPNIYVRDEGSTRRTPVMPRRSPPPPPSTRESHSISPQHVMEEQQHRASVIAPKASDKDGPLGMFWTTQHAMDRQVMEDKGPLFDEEPVRKTMSKQSVQNHEKWHSPPRGRQPPKKTDWGNPINKSNEDPSLDFEIRFDTDDDGSGKKRASHFDNEKTKVSGNNSTFQNDAFNTFVAEFDTTKLTPSTSSRISGKEIEAEVESLKDQLKQSNKEKTEITSKYEKLSAICRSQRQEIQELKQALATANQFLSNKNNLNNQSFASSLSYSPQRREKIEGSVLELQGEMLVNASPKANPDQKEWQPFTNEPKPQPKSKMNHPKSVRTTGSRPSSKQPNAGQSNESLGFDYESFTADPTSSRISKATTSSIQGSTSQRYNSSEVKKVETPQPAGWAGF